MLHITTSPRVALLIDGDNIPLSQVGQILKLARHFGELTICRAYGDWKKPPLSSFFTDLCNRGVDCQQVDRVAKQTTDRAPLNGGNEILHADDADLFIIASGDGHFRKLCDGIRQTKRLVIGIGNNKQTSKHLREACNKFYDVEELAKTLIQLEQLQSVGFAPYLYRAFGSIAAHNKGWINRGLLGNKLRELDPDFKQRFGRKKLSEQIRALGELTETNGQMVRLVDRETFKIVAFLRGL